MKIIETNRARGLGNIASIIVTVKNGKIHVVREYHNYCVPTTYEEPSEKVCLEIFKKLLKLDPNSLIEVLLEIENKTLKQEGKKLLITFLKKMEEEIKVI